MDTALDFVVQSRRRMIRIIALVLTIGAGLAFLAVAGLLATSRNMQGLLPYLVIIAVGFAGGIATLWLVQRHQLWQAILPLVLTIAIASIASVLLVPEQTLVAVPLLTIPVLLMALGQQRLYTIIVGITCTVVGAGLATQAPPPALGAGEAIIGVGLPLVNGMGAAILIVVIWLVANRLIEISDAAVELADHRAVEADAARLAAEEARAVSEQRLAEQQRLLQLVSTLETPIITIADHVLLAPIVGHLDSTRAERLSQRLLEAVHTQRASTVVLDIAGVSVVDTQVAQALVRTAQAVQLLGSSIVMTGMTSSIALTITSLGIRLDEFQSVRSPQEALQLIETQHNPA